MYMHKGSGFLIRFVRLLIFFLLFIVTFGIYGLYYVVNRIEEQNQMLDNILQELRRRE